MKKIAVGFMIAMIGFVTLFLAGPRTQIDMHLKTISLPEDIDRYLAQSEAKFHDIVPGAEKVVVWANAKKTKTPLSIVYLHGFSATRQETAPLCDELAARLGANLYYTRLTGHGRTGASLAEGTINDWLYDTVEALEIGKRLGDRLIVIGTSTGGTLATWLAEQPDTYEALAYVMISPNFGLRDPKSEILTWPWARQFVSLLAGPEYSWTPVNAQQGRYWTHRYPSTALVTMMGLVKYVRESDLASIKKPVLVFYSPNDRVVNAEEVKRRYAQFGSGLKELIPIAQSKYPENHVLAGDILAPGNTRNVEKIIVDFVAKLR